MLKPFNNHILVEIGEASAIQVANLDNSWDDVPKGTVVAMPDQIVQPDECYHDTTADQDESPFNAFRKFFPVGTKVLYKPGGHVVKFEENGKNYAIVHLDSVIAIEEATK